MSRHIGFTLLAIASIVFSSALIRYSEIGPIATGAYRLLLAIPMLLLVNYSTKKSLNPTPAKLSATVLISALMAGIFFALDLSVYNLAVTYTTLAEATLLTNMVPFFVAPISVVFFREKISPRFLLPVCAALCGLLLLLGSTNGGNNHLLGDLLALLSALFYSLFFISVKSARESYPAAKTMLIVCLIGGITLLTIAIARHETVVPTSLYGWFIVIIVAFFGQILGQTLLAYAIKFIPLNLSALFLLLSPVFAAFFAVIMFGEWLGWMQISGIIIILIAVHFGKKILERSLSKN